MKFYEVQKALEEGKKIRRVSANGEYISKVTNKRGKVCIFSSFSNIPIELGAEHLFADDWEIVEDIPKCKLQQHKQYLEEWKAELEDMMGRYNKISYLEHPIKYQEMFIYSIRRGAIEECLEHIKNIEDGE